MEATALIEAYKDFVLKAGQRPKSVYIFMKELGAKEVDYYDHFPSFGALEAFIFTGYVEETLVRLADSTEYKEYDSSQRVLAFFFTWLEVMTPERSFVRFLDRHGDYALFTLSPQYMQAARDLIESHVQKVIQEGIDEGEIADRMLITRFYKQGFWLQAQSILSFWLNDESQNFEQTDAMVEKTIRFAFNLIQPNSLDSGLDLVKFLWRSR